MVVPDEWLIPAKMARHLGYLQIDSGEQDLEVLFFDRKLIV